MLSIAWERAALLCRARKNGSPWAGRQSKVPAMITCSHPMGSLFCIVLATGLTGSLGAAEADAVRGADELFWVPTLEQGLAMARATGRPLFLMGYSLVPNGSTYTKLGADFCSGVF